MNASACYICAKVLIWRKGTRKDWSDFHDHWCHLDMKFCESCTDKLSEHIQKLQQEVLNG